MIPSTAPGRYRPSADLSALLVPVRAVAFWAAIVLPFLSIAVVTVGNWTEPASFGTLLAANAVAFLVGHGYHR